jgi:hypothetical protein
MIDLGQGLIVILVLFAIWFVYRLHSAAKRKVKEADKNSERWKNQAAEMVRQDKPAQDAQKYRGYTSTIHRHRNGEEIDFIDGEGIEDIAYAIGTAGVIAAGVSEAREEEDVKKVDREELNRAVDEEISSNEDFSTRRSEPAPRSYEPDPEPTRSYDSGSSDSGYSSDSGSSSDSSSDD